jgi:tetratricopeptide (TPR) repeat protein
MHRVRAAEAALKAALALEPRLTPARIELIRIYARQQRLGELDAQFAALAEHESLDFAYLSFWGMTRNLRWEPESDIAALRQSVDADPDDRASRLALAEGLRRLNRGREAEAVLAPMSADDPDARAVRAALAIDRGDVDEATRLATEGPEGHAGLALLRGQLALTRHEPAAAVVHFRAALAADPDDRRILFSLGTALRLVGHYAESRRRCDAARRFDALAGLAARTLEPTAASDADLHRRLAAACEAVGRRVEAHAWFRLAIGRNPLDAEAQRGLFRLGAGPRAGATGAEDHRSVGSPPQAPSESCIPGATGKP